MSEQQQTEDHVEEAVPHSEIAASVSDIPVDFGDPSVVDFPDAAFGEIDNDDDDHPDDDEPSEAEGTDDDEEEPGEPVLPDEDEEVEEPVLPPGIEEEQEEGQQ